MSLFKCVLLVTAMVTSNISIAQSRERIIDSLSNLLQQSKADTNRARLYIQIGDKYEQKNDSLSIAYYYKAILLSEELYYKWGEAVARQYLSELYTRYNKYDSAKDHLLRVMDLTQQMNDPKRIGIASNSMAIIFYRNGDYENALKYYLEAAKNFEKLDASMRILLVSCYTNIGSVFFDQFQPDKALQYIKQGYDIAVEIKNDIEIGYAACEMAAALQRNGKSKEAGLYAEKAVTIANKEDDLFLKVVAWQNLGSQRMQEENYTDALASFNQALSYAKNYGDTSKIALLLGYAGRTQFKLNNLPAAEENLTTALRYTTNIQDLNGMTSIYQALYELETAKGNYKKGFEFLKQYNTLQDTLYTLNKTKSLNVLESKYQNEKKVKEIAQLNVQRVQQELLLSQRNRWLTIAASAAIIILLASLYIYKTYRQKVVIAKHQQILQEEKINNLTQQQQVIALQSMVNGQESERTRIARDLHDSLGGMFSTVKMHFSTLQHEVPGLRINTLYKKSYELVDGAAEELRKIAHNMMPEVLLKMGLVPALQDFCNNISASKKLHISLQAYGMENRLEASKEIMIFRIVQELVNNIMKHAGATEAIIQFNRSGNNLSITVEDNGRGFDMQEAEVKQSMGIQTVKSRVIYLNGRISIDSTNNVGTTVMIDIILNEEA